MYILLAYFKMFVLCYFLNIDLYMFDKINLLTYLYGRDSGARACCAAFECVRTMTRMFFVHAGCSAADALVVGAGCRCDIRVHFVAAVLAEVPFT